MRAGRSVAPGEFLAQVENLELTPGSAPAKVIVNARTGTVVIGAQVQVMPAAVTHGSLTVTITESANVSQPNESRVAARRW